MPLKEQTMSEESRLSRRTLLESAGLAGAALGLGSTLGVGSVAFAQDAEGTPDAVTDAGTGEATPVAAGPAIPEEFSDPTNWPYENLDLSATRNVQSTNISADTVGDLGLAWSFPITTFGGFGALTANPIVVGDLVFIQDASANVYALHKDSGEQVWTNTYDDTVPSGGPNGLAVAYGNLYTTIGGVGDVVALDQGTGDELWRTTIQGPLHEGITTAPLVYDNVVYVSTIPGSSEGFYFGGQRGLIFALDASTGDVLWYFDTTTDNLWGNPRVNSGGGFWHPPAVDADGKLYIGIGNAAPWPGTEEYPMASSRPGDNDYANCILKLDPDTASLTWYYNVLPADPFDRDNQLTPVLATVDGRDVVFTSGKHGFAVSLDRATGEVIWRVPVGEHKNDETTEIPEGESIEVIPVASVETPMAFADDKLFLALWGFGGWFTATGPDVENHPFDLTSPTGSLVVLNASDGTTAWEVKQPTSTLGGATVTNDVVFTAGVDGVIRGYHVDDGTEVFRYQAPAGINTSPAVSGDMMIWAAGAPLVPSDDTADPNAKSSAQVVALKLGGTPQASPQASAEATPA